MKGFEYSQAEKTEEAIALVVADQNASFIGGGTSLVDLMKLNVHAPSRLVDINLLHLDQISEMPDNSVRIGSTARNSDVATNPLIRERYPVVSEALLSGASPQLRNMATIGGNLMQRTRCYYFRDTSFPACNKRSPGSGCSAIAGYNRIHAVLGTSDKCIATHPSDLCVALAAMDATILVEGGANKGQRQIPINEFFLEPGDTPERENLLKHGELITAVEIPPIPFAKRSHYLKIRDRASYEFALVSVAVAIDIQDDAIRSTRIALGGIATKPWRAYEAEELLLNAKPSEKNFRAAADHALRDAKPALYNKFKIELANRAMVRALSIVSSEKSSPWEN